VLKFKKGVKAEKKVEEMVPMIKEIRCARPQIIPSSHFAFAFHSS